MNSNIYKLDNTSSTGTATDCIVGNTSNSSIISNGSNYITYPYIPNNGITYYYNYPTSNIYDIQLRKVENGWILLKGGKEYILKSPDEIIKYMKDEKVK